MNAVDVGGPQTVRTHSIQTNTENDKSISVCTVFFSYLTLCPALDFFFTVENGPNDEAVYKNGSVVTTERTTKGTASQNQKGGTTFKRESKIFMDPRHTEKKSTFMSQLYNPACICGENVKLIIDKYEIFNP